MSLPYERFRPRRSPRISSLGPRIDAISANYAFLRVLPSERPKILVRPATA